jgi:hypothetical protein
MSKQLGTDIAMTETQRNRMSNAIRVWMKNLEDVAGWKEWRRKRVHKTLQFADPFLTEPQTMESNFVFSDMIEKQHAVVIQYLGLQQTIESLKECEYYFRRFPFRGLPVTRYGHITNVCEMYFSRFYEFRERTKKYFEAVKTAAPNHSLEIGKFIKLFDKTFYQELRARNGVHHHSRFEDIAIDHLLLTESISLNGGDWGWKSEHMIAYRKLVGEWTQRVRDRGSKMDEFLEAIAAATLSACVFLKPVPSLS